MKTTVLTLLFLLSSTFIHSQVVISEIMQSNVDCIMDDKNEFPDSWIELYNTTTTPIDLKQYKVGITSRPSEAWALPSSTIAPRGYTLIYCDKTSDKMHTSFRLESGKGACVYLFKNDIMVDSIINLDKQPAPNISYGRKNSDSPLWGYQHTPTPGRENCGTICTQLLGEPIFSTEGKVFTSSETFQLSLSLPENTPPNTEIRVSYSYSEPTESSPLYTGPITISSSRVVRAKLFNKQYLSPRSTTHSYIFLNREMTLPVISIVTNPEFFTDSRKGIYVDGPYTDGKKNYEHNWRRPINLELFDTPHDASALNQVCETRISGGASRGNKFKSLAIYANKRFGKKRFKYEFFPDQRPEQTNYKSLVLRNAGNDFDYLYMRDAIIQRTMSSHADLDWQAWQPSIIYINGEYKGILNIRERANEDNIFTNYNELEDIDVIENWNSLKQGTKDNINAFKAFFNEHDHTYAEYSQWMDVEEFINLMALNAFFNNIDFPANNIVLWRPRSEGGRWRFVAKDLDYTMGLYNQHKYDYKYFNWFYYNEYDTSCNWANTYDATRLFRRLMEDKDFNREFIDRMAIYMGDFMNAERIWEDIWQPMYEVIKTEYPRHRKLINEWWPKYTDEINSAKSWIEKRTSFMYSHLSDYYNVGTPCSLIMNDAISDAKLSDIDITINGIPLSRGKFNGKFFASRKITLDSTPHADAQEKVVGWKIVSVGSSGRNEITTDSPYYTFDMPLCSQLTITALFGTYDDIPQLASSSASNNPQPEYYDLNGLRLSSPKKGINIVRTTNGTYRKIAR